jgi:DAK2 domain fusion protein YloV
VSVPPDFADRRTLWALSDAWLRRAAQIIAGSGEGLNRLNVFPVSDADTGTNLTLTLQGISSSVSRLDRAGVDDVVKAAILSAHGNSGAIVAEMFTSVCRAIEGEPWRLARAPGAMVARLLRTVADAATQAVAEPVAGTILTVADAAATAAEIAVADHPHDALAVAGTAQAGAHEALARTPEQLQVLGQAGVVDAGGQAYVLLLDVLVEVLGGEPAVPLGPVEAPRALTRVQPSAPMEYEVMYALRGTAGSELDALRTRLSVLGSSVVVVGDATAAQVHVHLTEPGPAIEAALGLGSLSRIRVTALTRPAGRRAERTVVSVVAGPGLADVVSAHGGTPVRADRGGVGAEELTRTIASASGDLVVLPNDMASLELATHLARDLPSSGRRIAVLPTVAQVQGLAALAVHEPEADFDAAVAAMGAAARHARQGAVTVAERPAMTMAGRCEAGDVLGLVEGDFVDIGDSVVEVGWRVLQRLLALGGELLTLVTGVDAEPELLAELARRARAADPALEIETMVGGQPRYLVLMGLE